MKDAPKILTMRLKEPDEFGIAIEIEFGLDKIEKKIANGRGLARMSAILDDDGKLSDIELLTEKL